MARALMIQGTGSNVGKSVLLAGFARAFTRRGVKVRPFKPQNMSNNAAVTSDGGEIGRAQALQAWAAHCAPHTDMNPVLLKPESETGAQVILQGKRLAHLNAREYGAMKGTLLPAVLESYHRLCREADLVLVEGAGSPAEVNLRKDDIANMGFAEAAELPVILVGDINSGGVIAQIVGTKAVLCEKDNRHIKGFIVNKFRGEPALFKEGYRRIEAQTGWGGLGICPWFESARHLPCEDVLDITNERVSTFSTPARARSDGRFSVGCLMLNRIANFDDLDPLKNEADIALTMIKAGTPIPGTLDMVILPGSKSTIADLAFLRAEGWDIDIMAHVRRGGRVLGLCGGYQMLGKVISDPEGIEGKAGQVKGLGLLDIETVLTARKRLREVEATHVASGVGLSGYEIHIGRSDGADCARPFAMVRGAKEGATSADGLVSGTYLHGIFASDAFRKSYFGALGVRVQNHRYEQMVETTLDQLADHIETHCDVDEIFEIAALQLTHS